MFVEYHLTADDWLAYYEHKFASSSFLRETMVRQRWRALPWHASFGVLAGLAVRSWVGLAAGGFYVLIWLIDYPSAFRKGYRRNIQRLLTPERNPCLNGVHKLEVLPNGIRVTCEMSDTTMSWKRFRGAEVTPDFTFVTLTGECGLVIPRAAVVAGDYDAVAEALQGRAAVPANDV